MNCECGEPVDHASHCGCCGRPIGQFIEGDPWCEDCLPHLADYRIGIPPWDRTYFAQHGTDCPLDPYPMKEPTCTKS